MFRSYRARQCNATQAVSAVILCFNLLFMWLVILDLLRSCVCDKIVHRRHSFYILYLFAFKVHALNRDETKSTITTTK